MEIYKSLAKGEKKYQLVLAAFLLFFLIFNIQFPSNIQALINTSIGNVVVILVAITVLLNTQLPVGILALIVAYVIVTRNTPQAALAQSFSSSEKRKEKYLSKINDFPVTLEEEVVQSMVPLTTTNDPADMNYAPILENTYNALSINKKSTITHALNK